MDNAVCKLTRKELLVRRDDTLVNAFINRSFTCETTGYSTYFIQADHFIGNQKKTQIIVSIISISGLLSHYNIAIKQTWV